jgi:electron transport complex protein RnfA
VPRNRFIRGFAPARLYFGALPAFQDKVSAAGGKKMISNPAWMLMLMVLSGLSMNLILQFGLGLRGIALGGNVGKERLLAGTLILFVSIMLLWLIFTFIRSFLFLGHFEYVALFPVSSLVFTSLEYLTNRFIPLNTAERETLPMGDTLSGGALAGAALFLILNLADGFFEAAFLALGFSLSVALVFVVVGEIRRRAEMEAVPRWLKGGPLALIAMGLLSLIFSSGALMLFGVLR